MAFEMILENGNFEKFFKVPKKIYQDCPDALAENEKEIEFMFSQNNPYLLKGETWMGVEDEEARLAGFYHPDLQIEGQKVAFFGFWETSQDFQKSEKLFSDFNTWAKEKGARTVWGPINFSTFGNYRVKTSHFDRPPFHGEPWNKEHYAQFIERLGFTKKTEYLSYFSDDLEKVKSWMNALDLSKLHEASQDFNFIPLKPEAWEQRSRQLWQATNEIFSENFAFSEIDYGTFQKFYGPAFLARVCPETSMLIEHKDGEVAGFCINFPDYFPLLKKVNQKDGLFFSQMSFAEHIGLIESPTLLVKTVGLRPKYRQQGFPLLKAITEIVKRGGRYQRFGLCLMKEGNFLSMLMKQVSQETRRYGLFSKVVE